MNHLTESHLTEAQLDDHLIGDSSPEIKAHLDTCELCSARLSAAFAPISGFEAASLAWAERRSATMPMQSFSARQLTWHQRLAWTATMTAAIAVGFAVPLATNQARLERDQALVPSSTAASVEQPDDQIASDNQMLQEIDDQFATSADTPAALGLVSVAQPHTTSPSSLQD